MIQESGNRLLDRLESRFGRLALPLLLHWIAGFQVLSFCLSLLSTEFLEALVYDPGSIYRGEVWRLVSWVVFPSSLNLFFFLITTMFTLFISNSLESQWGSFRVNLYLLATIFLLSCLGLVPGLGMAGLAYGMILFSSAFLAFATLFPNQPIHLFGIIPIKAKWLGIADACYLLSLVLQAGNPLLMAVIVVAGLIPYLLTFGPGFFENRRRESEAKVRRHRFEQNSLVNASFHECASCGATEDSHPLREFRVSADGEEYCDQCRGRA